MLKCLLLLALILQIACCAMEKPKEPHFALTQEKISRATEKLSALKDEAASKPGFNKMHSSLWADAGLDVDYEMKNSLQMKGEGLSRMKRSVEGDATDMIRVEIKAKVTSDLLDKIRELGGVIIFSSERFSAITAEIPADKLQQVSLLPEVVSIRPALPPITHQSNVASPEGVRSHRVPETVENFPAATGSGISIGVISDSVDFLRDSQTQGYLPDVTVLAGQGGYGKTGEGTAMLEIVHSLAPDSPLFFATGAISEASFAQNILNLADEGCQVIVDDLIYASEPVFQDGVVAQAVAEVSSRGVAYFSSAGNSGNPAYGSGQVWEGDYSAGSLVVSGYLDAHMFGDRRFATVFNPTLVTLQWSDPFDDPQADLDLLVFDQAGNLQQVSSNTNAAFEYVIVPDGTWAVVVARKSGPSSIYIHVYSQKNAITPGTGGEIFGHASVPDCFAIAAIPALYLSNFYDEIVRGGENLDPEKFTSAGPRKVFYESNGDAITPGVKTSAGGRDRQKPDFTAADGVSTSLSKFDPFYGTSAAAPHAAAIAALMLSVTNGMSIQQIRDNLQKASMDIQTGGYDYITGHGVIDALSAVSYAMNTTVPSPASNVSPGHVIFVPFFLWLVLTLFPDHVIPSL